MGTPVAPGSSVLDDKTPSSAKTALLLIDVVNSFDFEGSESLVAAAELAAPRILALRDRCRSAGIPTVYVNDHFGQWRSDFRATVARCCDPKMPGHRVSRLLSPKEDDYFVLKPRHSAFFGTALDILLDQLEVDTLILVGFAANICVLYTASDAHMRGYRVIVPPDCTASNSTELTEQALAQMELVSCALTSTAGQDLNLQNPLPPGRGSSGSP